MSTRTVKISAPSDMAFLAMSTGVGQGLPFASMICDIEIPPFFLRLLYASGPAQCKWGKPVENVKNFLKSERMTASRFFIGRKCAILLFDQTERR